jgi:hypothetical protein
MIVSEFYALPVDDGIQLHREQVPGSVPATVKRPAAKRGKREGPMTIKMAADGLSAIVTYTAEDIPEDEMEEADQNEGLDRLQEKAKLVWKGDASFTVPEMNKILAGLVLRSRRWR